MRVIGGRKYCAQGIRSQQKFSPPSSAWSRTLRSSRLSAQSARRIHTRGVSLDQSNKGSTNGNEASDDRRTPSRERGVPPTTTTPTNRERRRSGFWANSSVAKGDDTTASKRASTNGILRLRGIWERKRERTWPLGTPAKQAAFGRMILDSFIKKGTPRQRAVQPSLQEARHHHVFELDPLVCTRGLGVGHRPGRF